ncbi:inositol monophosphatase family protein [Nocardioides acrostichi]|uniref:Inositol-1-monophosphatase n=1 Tax=Nocardioides acrostichi TaxID=2784339 RepID=A0A930V0G5_9ACTN|nr:inositol monophosphatase family protein [Nocardioides acrostichi]MBF4160969.1 inositol monophosphatase [Nocardioides acrostichi]
MTGPAPDPQNLLDLALEVAREAGALVRSRREGVVAVAATKSSATDVVTEADRASERLIRERLRAARPDDALLGEEGDDEPGTSGVRWVVDPIDGTVNFLYGLPQYAVSIAAQTRASAPTSGDEGWTTIAGVVLDVAHDVAWAGLRGPGGPVSTRDGVRLRVAEEPRPLGQLLVGTGFSYDSDVRARQGAAVAALLPRVRDIRRLGSCALDVCLVAAGALDGYVEEGVNLWDHAAATLVAEGAGARWRLRRGASGRDLLVCAPAHTIDALQTAAENAGFTG